MTRPITARQAAELFALARADAVPVAENRRARNPMATSSALNSPIRTIEAAKHDIANARLAYRNAMNRPWFPHEKAKTGPGS